MIESVAFVALVVVVWAAVAIEAVLLVVMLCVLARIVVEDFWPWPRR